MLFSYVSLVTWGVVNFVAYMLPSQPRTWSPGSAGMGNCDVMTRAELSPGQLSSARITSFTYEKQDQFAVGDNNSKMVAVT